MDTGVSEVVLGRIRKLQRLTRSNNEHEAALAAAKMQEILFAHNLSIEALRDPSEYVETERAIGARVWAQRLFATLCHNNFCQPLHGRAGLMYAVGKRENVEAVNLLFSYLAGEIDRFARAAYRRHRLASSEREPARTWTAAFRNGAVVAIAARLREQRERDIARLQAAAAGAEDGTAIMRRLDRELADEVARRYPNAGRHRGHRTWVRSSAGYQAGQEAGTRMSLTPARGHIEGSTSSATNASML